MLKELGGSAVEDATYRYLVSVPSATGAEVAEAVGVTPRAAAAVLSSLADKGLVTRATGQPTRYLAAPPNVAGQSLLLRQREGLVRAEAELLKLVDAYRQGAALRSVAEVVEVIWDSSAVRDRVVRMMRDARREFLALVTPPFNVIAIENAGDVRVQVSGANRTVYDQRVLAVPGIREFMLENAQPDEQWRAHHNVPMKLIIVDREVAVLSAVYAETGPPGTMLVHRSTLLDALVGFFQLIWSQAVPLPIAPDRPDDGTLSAEDSMLLSLLLSGLTDQAIAAHLGIGHRSVQRRVRRLMDLAGVGTRIQLGWRAHQRGWLSDGAEPLP